MAEKIIDGSYKENIYYLLCNLANLDGKSIVLAAINKEIGSTQLEKDETDEAIDSVTSKLELAKKRKEIMKDGPGAFLTFVNSFNDNELLVNYLRLLGFEDCLKEFEGAHDEEQRSNAIKIDIETAISSLTDELHKLETDDIILEERLKADYKTLENIKTSTNDAAMLIRSSVEGNDSFNKSFVDQTFMPFENFARSFDIIFPEKFVEEAEKAIFFPQDGFGKVVEDYNQGKYKEILYASSKSEEIDLDSGEEEEVIREVPINNVDITEEVAEETSKADEVTEEVSEEATNIDVVSDGSEEEVTTEEISGVTIDTSEEVEIEEAQEEAEQIEDKSTSEEVEKVEEEIASDNAEEEMVSDDAEEEIVSDSTEEIEDEVVEEAEEIQKSDEEDDSSDEGEEEVEESTNVADKIIEEMNGEVANLEASIENDKNEYGLYNSKVSNELKALLENGDKKLIETNLETLRALNVSDSTFYYAMAGYSYLTDKDLASKLNYLRGKGVSEKVVLDAVELHYIDCSLESIKEGVNALENSDLGFDKRYLPILKYGVDNFFNALEELRNNGIEPDDSEIAAYLPILTKYADNVASDTEVLKDYGISLLRKNGKYELGLYLKKPADLVQSIDDIIESGEEALINNTPEVLALDTDAIIQRLMYVKKNNVDYKEGEVYADSIYKPNLFNREFDSPELESIGSREECNTALSKSLNNDLCSIFIEVLDKYYEDERSYKAVDLSEEERGVFEELKALLEKEFDAKLINKNTYEMNGVTISRNKFERNLSCLVSALLSNGEDLLSEARETLIVAALYNSRRPEGMIMNIPQEVERETARLGGMAA